MTTNHWQDFFMEKMQITVNRLGLELASYNLTFEWISGANNKAVDCLSHQAEIPQDRPTTINMPSIANLDGPAFNTRSRTAQHSSSEDTTHRCCSIRCHQHTEN